MVGFNVTDPDTAPAPRRAPGFNLQEGQPGLDKTGASTVRHPTRGFLDEHPYLRGLTPEQQGAYGRCLLARRGPPAAETAGGSTGGG